MIRFHKAKIGPAPSLSGHWVKTILYLGLAACCTTLSAQYKSEQEQRIKKAEFPETALASMQAYMGNARKVRFYKETDGAKHSFEAKFKKDRLWYSVEFDEKGQLEDIEVLIRPVDIPEASFTEIRGYLGKTFGPYRIRKIQQQYGIKAFGNEESTFKNAFQNLISPLIRYEIVITGKTKGAYKNHEVIFNALGGHEGTRQLVRPEYQHILYHD